jgi:hypothetical protein
MAGQYLLDNRAAGYSKSRRVVKKVNPCADANLCRTSKREWACAIFIQSGLRVNKNVKAVLEPDISPVQVALFGQLVE